MTPSAQDDITLLARGIILDPKNKRVVATPFPKFFNVGERLDAIPDLPFEKFEKLDGSLIILFYHKGEWHTATKGSLGSEQAKWAVRWITAHDLSCLDKETTYLAEALYPENRIVVHYQHTGLVLLGASRGDGSEIAYDELRIVACRPGAQAGPLLRWRNRPPEVTMNDTLDLWARFDAIHCDLRPLCSCRLPCFRLHGCPSSKAGSQRTTSGISTGMTTLEWT
jgi:RNA ligase